MVAADKDPRTDLDRPVRPRSPARFDIGAARLAASPEIFDVIFLCWDEAGRDPQTLVRRLAAAATAVLPLTMITNRGVKVYPEGLPETFCTDHWRCRFKSSAPDIPYQAVLELMQNISKAGLDIIKTENLCTFDGKPGFSLGQGE